MFETTCARIRENRLIAILRKVPADKLVPAARAICRGGVRVLEVTLDHSRTDCAAEAAAAIRTLREALGGEISVGAGTVLTPEEVDAVADAGAELIVSPNVNEAVILRTVERGLVSCPGALTPSEIVSAWESGATFVKVFPAGVMGAKYIKDLQGPLGHIPLLAVGGVGAENAAEYLRAGVLGIGAGGKLVDAGLIRSCDWEALEANARAVCAALRPEA